MGEEANTKILNTNFQQAPFSRYRLSGEKIRTLQKAWATRVEYQLGHNSGVTARLSYKTTAALRYIPDSGSGGSHFLFTTAIVAVAIYDVTG